MKSTAATKEWRARNRAHLAEYERQRRANRTEEEKAAIRAKDRKRRAAERARNREEINARLREWCRANPDKVLARNKRWAAANPEKIRAAKARRRAVGSLTAVHIIEIRNLQNGKCAYCSIKLTRKIEQVDHIVALANGGTNDRRNIQLLCSRCNQTKGKRDPIIFAQSLGRLV